MTAMNYIKITYNIFVVKNQNGFNNALYDYMRIDDNSYAKQYVRSMVTNFPKNYPAVVIFRKEYETYRIFVDVLNKNEVSSILECFEKFVDAPEKPIFMLPCEWEAIYGKWVSH